MYKISNDKEKCIGCGMCVQLCDNWELKDGKGNPKKSKVKEIGCNEKAKESCPVQCIKVEEVK
tara:strand:+ start:423 stop:611 length:189 start_codon:yes stop_codon:yes gene_type:complete